MGSSYSTEKVSSSSNLAPCVNKVTKNKGITNIKNYQWENQIIGKGTNSVVYLGENKYSKEIIAIKKICYEKITNLHKGRINREVSILKMLKKLPNSKKYFVSLLDSFTDQNGNIFIISKFIDGFDLSKVVSSRKTLKEDFIKKLIYQLLLVVHLLHSNNIAHRDIKLENIMYDQKSKSLKLVDFGFAIKTNDEISSKNSNEYCGSVHYLAPEIIQEKPYDAKKVDVWAIGILTFALCFGKFPFNHAKEEIIFSDIVSGNYYIPNTVSNDCKKFISCILQQNPTKRPSVSSLLLHPWLQDAKQVN